MSGSVQRLSARIGRWPRRMAALACLVLAAASALLPPAHPASRAVPGIAATLNHGEVAVPLPVSVDAVRAVRAGDRVGVLAVPPDTASSAAAALVADRLRVLSVSAASTALGDSSTAEVLIATDRVHALRLARYSAQPLILILDDS